MSQTNKAKVTNATKLTQAVAQIEKLSSTYTITWVVNGQSSSQTYNYGETPVYNGTPTKPATAQYAYTFAGWDKDITTVTDNETYTAQFDQVLRSYTVTWIVEGVEQTQTYNYGETPVYNGTPTKEADSQYTYTFAGWDKEIVAVTDNQTYTATFNAEQIPQSSSSEVNSESSSESSSSEISSESSEESSSEISSESSEEISSEISSEVSSSETSQEPSTVVSTSSSESTTKRSGCGSTINGNALLLSLLAFASVIICVKSKRNKN